MIPREKINQTLDSYNKEELAIATVCSHSSLQIFLGAKQEGFKTIGICAKGREKIYDAFPLARPDELIMTDGNEIGGMVEELVEKNSVLIPHGSLVEYFRKEINELKAPIFGNREVLSWESDRNKMFQWMQEAELNLPETYKPDDIPGPAIVKFPGAKGGAGYVVIGNEKEYEKKMDELVKLGTVTQEDVDNALIQEYMIGVRMYPHYFYSPLSAEGYKSGKGHLEMLSMDRRIETNVEDIYRPLAAGLHPTPSFTVIGNEPAILRESLVPAALEVGRKTAEAADRLFKGIPGPFCVEMLLDENMKFRAFEISARIVAGTNVYPMGSQYTPYMFKEPMSTGRRIAREIKQAAESNRLPEVIY